MGIFETDPEHTERKPKFEKPDSAFIFRAGYQENNLPQKLSKWRVTTHDRDIAAAVAQSMGGSVTEWETSGDDFLQVFTDTVEVPILLDGPDAIDVPLIQWGPNKQPIHICDGVTMLGPDKEDIGKPCGCPRELKQRKQLARKGRGPKPEIKVWFRLAEDEDLGRGYVKSNAWDFLLNLRTVVAELERIGGPAVGTLKLNHVNYETDTHTVEYYHGEIHSLKSYNDAVSGE
ncbi:recombination directionality factor [Streptomyces lycii]|nr:hypothetical protein [Streptomyces lycii]